MRFPVDRFPGRPMRVAVDRYPDDKKWFVRAPGAEGPVAFSLPTAAFRYAERVGSVATDGEGHVQILEVD